MAMEELTKIKTLRSIIDYISNIFQSQPETRPDKPAHDQQTAATTQTSSAQEQRPSFDRERLTMQLLQVVSERTGYPSDMLGLDLNIEADLGIDSIKRVEILGALQRTYLSNYGETQMAMEELTKIKTLRGIIDYISNIFRSQPGDRPDKPTPDHQAAVAVQTFSERTAGDVEVSRCLLTTVNVPLRSRPLKLTPDAVFIVTDDERGVAQTLSDKLSHLGGRVVLVRMGYKTTEVGTNLYTADLTNPTAVEDLITLVRKKHGSITGIIHLLPLKTGMSFEEMDIKEWRNRLCLEVKSLFYFAKSAGADLKRAAEVGCGWLVAATGMGGVFTKHQKEFTPFSPSQSGIAGLIKTLAIEWTRVCCKAVHLDKDGLTPGIADSLLCEMSGGDRQVEVVYKDSHRFILQPRQIFLNQNRQASLTIDASWVILITGGAKALRPKWLVSWQSATDLPSC